MAKNNHSALGPLSGCRLGQYRLGRKIGEGGMGTVYEAVQENLGHRVAVKILSPRLMEKAVNVQRFEREAKAAARLQHPNIVTIFDTSQEQGFYFYTMELVDGSSLQTLIEEKGPLGIELSIDLLRQAIEGLAYAWEQDIIHRDIKPDNLMLSTQGVLKIADFGLAKARMKTESLGLTGSGLGMGTPYYMSPEQALDAKTVDHRADIYSLGATFYHLLTGKVPFEGSSPLEVAMKAASAKFTPIRKIRPEVPLGLAELIERMLAKEPDLRYESKIEILLALDLIQGCAAATDGDVESIPEPPQSGAIPSDLPPLPQEVLALECRLNALQKSINDFPHGQPSDVLEAWNALNGQEDLHNRPCNRRDEDDNQPLTEMLKKQLEKHPSCKDSELCALAPSAPHEAVLVVICALRRLRRLRRERAKAERELHKQQEEDFRAILERFLPQSEQSQASSRSGRTRFPLETWMKLEPLLLARRYTFVGSVHKLLQKAECHFAAICREREGIAKGELCAGCGDPIHQDDLFYCNTCGKIVWGKVCGCIVFAAALLALGLPVIAAANYGFSHEEKTADLIVMWVVLIVGWALTLIGLGALLLFLIQLSDAARIRGEKK